MAKREQISPFRGCGSSNDFTLPASPLFHLFNLEPLDFLPSNGIISLFLRRGNTAGSVALASCSLLDGLTKVLDRRRDEIRSLGREDVHCDLLQSI